MTLSANLVGIGAVLAFALLVTGVAWSCPRLLTYSNAGSRPEGAAPRPRRRLGPWRSALAFALLMYALFASAHAAQVAFGAPMGEPVLPAVTVVEIRECERPVSGFGLVRRCTLAAYRSEEPLPGSVHPVVVGGGVIEPGDRVAKYAASGWTRFLPLIGGESQWRPLGDAAKPDLAWLQAAAPVVGLLVLPALSRPRARRRAADEEVR